MYSFGKITFMKFGQHKYCHIMKYYRYLDLDYKNVIDKISPSLLDEFSDSKSFFVPLSDQNLLKRFPEIQQIFDPINLQVDELALIVYNSQWHNFIHIDDPTDKSRINLPVLNCEKSQTNFYELKQGKSLKTDPISEDIKNVFYANPQDCVLLDSFCLNQATALRTNVLHNVTLNSDVFFRVSLTVKFKEDIDYLLE